MKKLVMAFVSIMIIIFILVSYMVYVDKKDSNNLNDMIVKEAIREYYDNNLEEYIDTLQGYDNEINYNNNIKKM